MEEFIAPGTDGTFTIIVTEDGVTHDDATVTADVFFRGTQVGTNVSCTSVGLSTGQYRLPISRTWSITSGKYLQGEMMARFKINRGGNQAVVQFRWPVRFDDTE